MTWVNNDEALKTAIDDVNAVAGELRELRQKIQHYGEASERLDKVSEALVKLSETVSSVHQGIGTIVQRAEQVYGQIESSRGSVEVMTSSIPQVVERIEASDVTRGLAEFTRMLSEVRDLISNQQGLTTGLQSFIGQMSELTTDVKGIRDSFGQQGQLLQLINQVLMQNVAGPVTDSARLLTELKSDLQGVERGATKASEGMASLSVRLLSEFETMKKELISLRTGVADSNESLREQRILLEKAANKKGFSF